MKFTEADLFVTIFVDASFCPKLKAAGFGAWVKFGAEGHTHRVGGPIRDALSPGDAETFAIMKALKYAISVQVPVDDRVIIVQSDCLEALSRATQMHKRLQLPPEYYTARRVIFRHVKGHNGYACVRSAVNTWCDKEAKRQMRRVRIEKRKEKRDAKALATVR